MMPEPMTGEWLAEIERDMTHEPQFAQDCYPVIEALIAEVKRLRDISLALPLGRPGASADFNAMAERHGSPVRVSPRDKITEEHQRLWREWTR